MLCPLLIGFGNSLNRRERREDLPKSDAGHLVGFCPADGQLGLQVAGGVGETGFLPSHCLVLFFGFCFLCSFHSNFLALLNSIFGLIIVCALSFRGGAGNQSL